MKDAFQPCTSGLLYTCWVCVRVRHHVAAICLLAEEKRLTELTLASLPRVIACIINMAAASRTDRCKSCSLGTYQSLAVGPSLVIAACCH